MQVPIGHHRSVARHQLSKYPSADKVIATFNTWAFKREQPSDAKLLASVVEKAIAMHSPDRICIILGQGTAG